MASNKKKFNWRSFVSLYMTFSGIIIAISGIILYIAPPGRIANWTHLTILGLEKSQWQALHTMFTFIFLIAAGFHIYYNWKPLIAYLRTKFQKKTTIRVELYASVLITVLLYTLILFEVPPFSTVMDFGESVKDGWSSQESEPPVPHAEEMSLEKLAEITKQPLEKFETLLQENNIAAKGTDIVANIAKEYHLTPQELYEIMQVKPSQQMQRDGQKSSQYSGKGYGRMSFEDACSSLQVEPEVAIKRLQDAGYAAQKGSTLKEIATQNNLKPIDVINTIKSEQN